MNLKLILLVDYKRRVYKMIKSLLNKSLNFLQIIKDFLFFAKIKIIYCEQSKIKTNKKFKNSLIVLCKQALYLVLIFQLSTYPYLTLANPTESKTQKNGQSLKKAKAFNEKHVTSLRKLIFGEQTPKDRYVQNPLDYFGLLGQQTFNKNSVKLQNIFVEIFNPTDDKNKQELQALLSHPSQKFLVDKVLQVDALEKWNSNSVFINTSKEQLSFRLTSQGQVLNSFAQNIEWMAFFDNYLIFQEAPNVSEKKAFISFIDLSYFEKAIGKTPLPIFQIPVNYESTNTNAKALLTPEYLSISGVDKTSVLSIDNIELSKNQLDYLAALQQMSFNVTVSLIDPKSAHISQAYLKEIVSNYHKEDSTNKNDLVQTVLGAETKKLILKLLENRRQIGSSEDISGNYGNLNKLNLSLTDGPVAQEFKDNLLIDKSFQDSVLGVHTELHKKRKFFNRYFAFLSHLTRPQPLGSPKITQALGLIANSVSLSGDTIETRFQAFEEGFKQLVYPQKNRRNIYKTMAVLTGAATVASPDIAGWFLVSFSASAEWVMGWGELLSVTAKQSFTWLDLEGIKQAYFIGDKPIHLLTGMSALFGITIAFIGSLNFSVNLADFIKKRNSQKEQAHQDKVTSLRSRFIAYMEENRRQFFQDLSNAEKNKLGLNLEIEFGLHQIKSNQLFKTSVNVNSFHETLNGTKKINLEFQVTKEGVTTVLDLVSAKPPEELAQDQILLKLNGSQRVFTATENSNLSVLLKGNNLDPDISISLELSAKNFHTKGQLENSNFSEKDNKKIQRALHQIEKETGKPLAPKDNSLSQTEITTLNQAMSQFAFGYSSWAKTFRMLGLTWNWFFLGRSLVLTPLGTAKMLYFSKYFDSYIRKKHLPTFWNGGHQNRLNHWITRLQAEASIEQMKAFEEDIVKVEKQILIEVEAQAYLELVNLASKQSTIDSKFSQIDDILSTNSKNLKVKDIKNKKQRAFYGIYKRELFKEVMTKYVTSQLNIQESSNYKFKISALKKHIQDDTIFSNDLTQTNIRKLVEQTAKEKNISEKSLEATNNFISGFLKRLNNTLNQNTHKSLTEGMQMERFSIGKNMLNEPEALARATRQQIVYFLTDKPIEILFTFVFLAGVDQGILQILHDRPFTDEAWFHLSRYAIWSGFFAGVVLEILAGVWLKVQMDARLASQQGFDKIPSKEEARQSYFKWVYKQFNSEENSWWKNHKYNMELALANLVPATINMAIIWALTLGRFDLEVYLAGYSAFFLLPFAGINFKLENAFEQSANYSLKELIKQGIDLSGKDKKLLTHPNIQEIHMKESFKLRRKFNIWLALLYNNPIGNILEVFLNTDTVDGSRAFIRRFLPTLPTEHIVNLMDFLQDKQIVSSKFSESCKNIFTNNRTDL